VVLGVKIKIKSLRLTPSTVAGIEVKDTSETALEIVCDVIGK
jgi:hypothetical protein